MAEIHSPLPGVLHRRPAPDKDMFVNKGDRVEAGQTIGLVEIMKQFTEVKSEDSGTIVEFQIADGGAVNPGDIVAIVDAD